MPAERATANRVERDLHTVESLYIVRVEDHVDALELIGLLLGGDPGPVNGAAEWTRAVPGGRRTITLAPTSDHTG